MLPCVELPEQRRCMGVAACRPPNSAAQPCRMAARFSFCMAAPPWLQVYEKLKQIMQVGGWPGKWGVPPLRGRHTAGPPPAHAAHALLAL